MAVAALMLLSSERAVGQAQFIRRGGLLSDSTLDLLLDNISGERALFDAGMIGRYARFPGSAGYHKAAEHVVEQAKAAGLQQVEIHRFPFQDIGWNVLQGTLHRISPDKEKITDISDVSLAVVRNSHDADVTAELVDIGSGLTEADYAGKQIEGKIVLTSSHPARVQAESIFKRKALGIVSSFRGNFYGLRTPERSVSWGSMRWKGLNSEPGAFGFMVSSERGEELRNRLNRKEKVELRAFIRVAVQDPAELEMVTGVLPGRDIQDQDLILSAHLDHPQPAANDNASGSAALLEVARVLNGMLSRGEIPPLRRNVRFWWVCELETTQAYIFRHPDEAKRILLDLNVDQAGGDRLGRNDYVVQAALRFTPSFLNALVANFTDYAMSNYSRVHNAPSMRFVAPSGTNAPFVVRFWKDEDEKPVTDSIAFVGLQIPGVNFAVPSFDLIHSSGDSLDRLDPTQLKRSCFLMLAPTVYLATLKPQQVPALGDVVLAYGSSELSERLQKSFTLLQRAQATDLSERFQLAREVILDGVAYEQECIDSINILAEGEKRVSDYLQFQKDSLAEIRRAHEGLVSNQVKERAAALLVNVPVTPPPTADESRLARTVPVMSSAMGQMDKGIWDYPAANYPEWYAKHSINNRRSVIEIYRVIHVLYNDYRLAQLVTFMETMEKKGLIRLR